MRANTGNGVLHRRAVSVVLLALVGAACGSNSSTDTSLAAADRACENFVSTHGGGALFSAGLQSAGKLRDISETFDLSLDETFLDSFDDDEQLYDCTIQLVDDPASPSDLRSSENCDSLAQVAISPDGERFMYLPCSP